MNASTYASKYQRWDTKKRYCICSLTYPRTLVHEFLAFMQSNHRDVDPTHKSWGMESPPVGYLGAKAEHCALTRRQENINDHWTVYTCRVLKCIKVEYVPTSVVTPVCGP